MATTGGTRRDRGCGLAPRRIAAALACSAVIGIGGAAGHPREAHAVAPVSTAAGSPDATADPALVYYGDARRFRRPAVLTLAQVFRSIPAYQEIERESLTRNDAEYWVLLNRANAVFNQAVGEVATREGYDLVAEVGSVRATNPRLRIPDITDLVVQAIGT